MLQPIREEFAPPLNLNPSADLLTRDEGPALKKQRTESYCDVCNIWFTERRALLRHCQEAKVHFANLNRTPPDRFNCASCKGTFVRRHDLQRHNDEVHTGQLRSERDKNKFGSGRDDGCKTFDHATDGFLRHSQDNNANVKSFTDFRQTSTEVGDLDGGSSSDLQSSQSAEDDRIVSSHAQHFPSNRSNELREPTVPSDDTTEPFTDHGPLEQADEWAFPRWLLESSRANRLSQTTAPALNAEGGKDVDMSCASSTASSVLSDAGFPPMPGDCVDTWLVSGFEGMLAEPFENKVAASGCSQALGMPLKSCSVCRKQHSDPTELRVCMLKHLDYPQRPYMCRECNFGFVRQSHLEYHLQCVRLHSHCGFHFPHNCTAHHPQEARSCPAQAMSLRDHMEHWYLKQLCLKVEKKAQHLKKRRSTSLQHRWSFGQLYQRASSNSSISSSLNSRWTSHSNEEDVIVVVRPATSHPRTLRSMLWRIKALGISVYARDLEEVVHYAIFAACNEELREAALPERLEQSSGFMHALEMALGQSTTKIVEVLLNYGATVTALPVTVEMPRLLMLEIHRGCRGKDHCSVARDRG